MIILGITGGSGSGKSTVCDVFRKNNIDVIDADKVARMVVKPGQKALEEIISHFGIDILKCDKTLDRQKLASIVFNNKDELLILNKITHKYITDYVNTYINNYKKDILVIDAPLLFESELDKKCDYILSVIADKETRIKRIINRDNISREKAVERINSQKIDKFYIENSDFLVYNDNNIIELEKKTQEIINELGEKAK